MQQIQHECPKIPNEKANQNECGIEERVFG